MTAPTAAERVAAGAEYGIWGNEEGTFVETQLYTFASACAALNQSWPVADGYSIAALCPNHRDEEQPADTCELCDDGGDEPEEENRTGGAV